MHTCIFIYIYGGIYGYKRVYIYIYMNTYVFIYININIHMYIYICVCECACVRVCVSVCVYFDMRTHVYEYPPFSTNKHLSLSLPFPPPLSLSLSHTHTKNVWLQKKEMEHYTDCECAHTCLHPWAHRYLFFVFIRFRTCCFCKMCLFCCSATCFTLKTSTQFRQIGSYNTYVYVSVCVCLGCVRDIHIIDLCQI